MADIEGPAGIQLHNIDSNTIDISNGIRGGESHAEHNDNGNNNDTRNHHDTTAPEPEPSPPTSQPEEPQTMTATTVPADLRDGTELSTIRSSDTTRNDSVSSISSGSVRMVTRRSTANSARTGSTLEPTGPFRKVKKFWFRHVVVSVSHKQNRDHFALERTYLAFIRTSLTFAMLGVLIAQLFSLNRSVVHDEKFGFYKIGKPLSCVCHGIAILVAASGAYRFWRQQNALARGKVHAGGREMLFVFAITMLVIVTLFVIVIVISAKRDSGI